MFFKAKPPIPDDYVDWQLDAWDWLLEHLIPLDKLRDRPLICPTKDFFPPTHAEGHDKALHIFEIVARWIGVDPSDFDLIPQDAAPSAVLSEGMALQPVPDAKRDPLANAVGTFSYKADASPNSKPGTFTLGNDAYAVTDIKKPWLQITYNPDHINQPEQLIATFAHEICHPVLFAVDAENPDTLPGGEDRMEPTTDLATIFFGFGMFGANNAHFFRSGNDGWSSGGTGYLKEAEWAFGLAVFLQLTENFPETLQRHLKPSVWKSVKQSLKYLDANPDLVASLG